jgi:hypothetical protein
MERDELRDGILAMWRRNNEILLYLLAGIPPPAMKALPAGSKGRDVTAQFAHLESGADGSNTSSWAPSADPRYDKTSLLSGGAPQALVASGRDVEQFLRRAIDQDARPKMFGRDPVRCGAATLIAHDSHHRGQILLALAVRRPPARHDRAERRLGQWILGK